VQTIFVLGLVSAAIDAIFRSCCCDCEFCSVYGLCESQINERRLYILQDSLTRASEPGLRLTFFLQPKVKINQSVYFLTSNQPNYYIISINCHFTKIILYIIMRYFIF
jgi:hypothetical protein